MIKEEVKMRARELKQQGHKLREIAEQLDLPIMTVKNLVYREGRHRGKEWLMTKQERAQVYVSRYGAERIEAIREHAVRNMHVDILKLNQETGMNFKFIGVKQIVEAYEGCKGWPLNIEVKRAHFPNEVIEKVFFENAFGGGRPAEFTIHTLINAVRMYEAGERIHQIGLKSNMPSVYYWMTRLENEVKQNLNK